MRTALTAAGMVTKAWLLAKVLRLMLKIQMTTALMIAARWSPGVVEVLLTAGAEVNATVAEGIRADDGAVEVTRRG